MVKMNYEDFKAAVKEGLAGHLPESARGEISVIEILKNNSSVLDAVTVRQPGRQASPTIYLSAFYEEYCSGKPMETVLDEIAELHITHSSLPLDIEKLMDHNFMMAHVTARIISREKNRELLLRRPHRFIEDLAVVYYVLLEDKALGMMSIPVTNALSAQYQVGEEALYHRALENMESLTPPVFRSMGEILQDLMQKAGEGHDTGVQEDDICAVVPQAESLYVLSNKQNWHGAAAILNDRIMDVAAGIAGKRFYVLPSSVHELLIVPVRSGMTRQCLEEMVREVNATELKPEELLSDHVYVYDSGSHALKFA